MSIKFIKLEIKLIMKTMDLTSPKIFKENNAVVWVIKKKER